MKTLCVLSLVSVAMLAPAMAANQSAPQTPVPRQELFGTCAWWNNPLPGTSPPESGLAQLYRIAFAQGVVLGMDGTVWATINDYREPLSPTAVADLASTFLLGYRALLVKPQLMVLRRTQIPPAKEIVEALIAR